MLQEKLLAQRPPHKGHKWYEYNQYTKELNLAEIENNIGSTTNENMGTKIVHHKVVMKQDYIYFSALNLKNAKRKVGL